jgi:hypothetical protein
MTEKDIISLRNMYEYDEKGNLTKYSWVGSEDILEHSIEELMRDRPLLKLAGGKKVGNWRFIGKNHITDNIKILKVGIIKNSFGADIIVHREKIPNHIKIFELHDRKSQKMIITKETEQGNFKKVRNINDSTYILSYGRGPIEYIVDTVRYGDRTYDIDWETPLFLSLIKGCGTYCWSNAILNLQKQDTVMYFSYVAVDAKKRRIVDVDSNGNFIVFNLFTKEKIIVPSRYYEFRNDGYPLFCIDNVKLDDSLLAYEIRKDDGTIAPIEVKLE